MNKLSKSQRAGILWAGVALVFLLLAVFVSITMAIVVTLFLLTLMLKIDRVVPLAICLILMVLAALLVAIDQAGAAEGLSNWAFYFLAIGIVTQFIDFVRFGSDHTGHQVDRLETERAGMGNDD